MKEERAIFLDALRGIAAIIVVFYHFLLSFYPALFTLKIQHSHTENNIESSIALTPISMFYNGPFAVCLFFVLSGFVLSMKFFRDKNIESVYSGAIRRYFRLGIPIFFSVLLSYLIFISNLFYHNEVAKLTYCTFWLSDLWKLSPSIIAMLQEGIYRVLFKGGNSEYNPALWTMYLEFMGSLLVFAILALAGKFRNRIIIYLILIFVFRDSYFLAFILGLSLCDFYYSKYWKKIHWSFNLIIAAVAFYLGSYQKFEVKNIWSSLDELFLHDRQTLSIISAVLILFSVLNSSTMKIILSKKVFHNLGNISFSLYLIHLLVLGSFSSYLFSLFINNLHWDYHFAFFIMFIVSFSIIILLSHFMYRFVDMNGIRFSKYFYEKFLKQKLNQ